MNLIKEMPLSKGSRLANEDLLMLVSVLNPQSEQIPEIFPGIGSQMSDTSRDFSSLCRELSGGVSSKCCCSPDSPAALGRSVIVCTRGMLGTKIRQMGHSGLLPLRRTDCSEPVKTPLNFDEKWIKKKKFSFSSA